MKIAYIGIDLFLPVLLHLIDRKCEVIKVFTCKTDNVTEFNTEIVAKAKELNIECTKAPIKASDFEELYNKGCEAVFCAGYYHKIPIFDKIPTLNIHPSLLPYGRGSWPMVYDILYKREFTGITIHKISEGYDEGDILLQKKFPISTDETHKTLMKKHIFFAKQMIDELLNDFNRIYANSKKQQEPGVYLKTPDEKVYTLNKDFSLKEADLVLRAFSGYECIYVDENKKYVMIDAFAVSKEKIRDFSDKFESFCIKDGYILCEKDKAKLMNN